MTEQDQHEIARIIRATAHRQAQKAISNDREYKDSVRVSHRTGKRRIAPDKGKCDFILHLLQTYRQSPQNRETVNRLIRAHRDLPDTDRYFRTRHNLIVLQYIIETPMAKKDIQRKLRIASESTYAHQHDTAIREMSEIWFGYDPETRRPSQGYAK